MKSKIALLLSTLALALSVHAAIRPLEERAPEPLPILAPPRNIPIGYGDLPELPDAWMPSAWDPGDH